MVAEPAQPELGLRVKRLRKESGLTLQDVAVRSGVSISTLSKIENGRSAAGMDTVVKVARGLGVLFQRLVEDPPPAPAAGLSRLVVTKAGDAHAYPTEIYDYADYSAQLRRPKLMPLMITVKTRSVPALVDWSTHPGEEFIFVLEGAIDLHTEHYAPQRLEQGDTAYFDSLMRHAFVAVGTDAARILSVGLSDRTEKTTTETERPSAGSPLRAMLGPTQRPVDPLSRKLNAKTDRE